jgi:hypothetical protein
MALSITKASNNSDEKISLLVKSLSGVLTMDKKQDHRKLYADFWPKNISDLEKVFINADVALDLLGQRSLQ